MRVRALVYTLALIALAAPGGGAGQIRPHSFGRDVVEPTLVGGSLGLALGMAYVGSRGDAWLLDDGDALLLSLAAGTALAWAVHERAEPGAGTRLQPRLRAALEVMGPAAHDFTLALRVPLRERTELDAGILIAAKDGEVVEEDTRCGGWFGCMTADFITSMHFQQTVSAFARAVHRLPDRGYFHPALAVGGGPTLACVQVPGRPPSAGIAFVWDQRRSAGLLVDAGAGIEGGQRRWWSVEAGGRAILGLGSGADLGRPTWYVRTGLAWGR